MAAIGTEGLRKAFRSMRALDDLTLAVEPGRVFGLLGPNGAGKTATIRLLGLRVLGVAGNNWMKGVPELTGG